jgi:hypothetical protein
VERDLEDLTRWTYETVERVVRTYQLEPGPFDFKTVLTPARGEPKARADALASLRRTVCGMANTEGGIILFGVRDRQEGGARPEERIVGIPTGGDLAKECADKLQAVEPNVRFIPAPAAIPLPSDASRGVFLIHIPRSARRPHMVEGTFYRRSSGGTAEPMTVDAVRDQMLFTEERLRRMTLFRLELRLFQRQLHLIKMHSLDPDSIVIRFDMSAFKTLLADICPLLPGDEAFLEQLLRIPEYATIINRVVERYERTVGPSTPTPYVEARRQVLAPHIRQLELDLFQCATALEEQFGPLTGRGPWV